MFSKLTPPTIDTGRKIWTRKIVKARISLVKIRFLIVGVVKRMLLGSIVSGAPLTIIRSLEESSHDEVVSHHIVEETQIYNEKFEYYEFPESYPPQFRRCKGFERKSVFLLRDVLASPLTGVIWLPEGRILQESVGSLGRLMGWGNTLYDVSLPVSSIRPKSAVVCCPPTGYYHWLLEVLPNVISAIEKYPDVKVLLLAESPGYIKEALVLLLGDGFRSRLIECDSPIRATRIVMPQFEGYSGFVRLEDLEILRNSFLCRDSKLAELPRRFYISRSRTPKRRIGNEMEIESALVQEGFETVHLEEMTFGQQVELFSRADEIVAPHGAGLANLVWVKSHSRVLEIFPNRFFNDCYARLAVSRSLNYHHVTCKPDANSHGAVDLDQIMAWLSGPGGL